MASASSKQLALLKRLAARTGTSFTHPDNKAQATAEIRHMQELPSFGRTFAERDRSIPGIYATGRFSEPTRFGPHASDNAQRTVGLGGQSEVPILTDSQERAIIDHQDQTGDEIVSSSVADAAEYLDQAFEKTADNPTEKQLAYLHDLERPHGLPESQPATKLAASRRIDAFLQRDPAAADADNLVLMFVNKAAY